MLSRHPEAPLEPGVRHVGWDGRTLGDWAAEVDGADAVVNLAGRTVSCRYTDTNLRQMMDSRVDSARVVGSAIEAAPAARRLAADEHRHHLRRPLRRARHPANDEATGMIGGEEPHTPLYWEYSVRIARRWEEAQAEADLPATRQVALRTAMVMSPDRGGVFDVLLRLTRLGLGGPVAGGRQFVSWIHDATSSRGRLPAGERPGRAGQPRRARPRSSGRADAGLRTPGVAGPGGSACRRRPGWRAWAPGRCAATPSCSSRAAGWSPAASSTRASPSPTRPGPGRPRTWSRVGRTDERW